MDNSGQYPDQMVSSGWGNTFKMMQETMGSLAGNLSAMNLAMTQNAEFLNSSLSAITASLAANTQQMSASVAQLGDRLGDLEEKTKGKFLKNFLFPLFSFYVRLMFSVSSYFTINGLFSVFQP